MSTIILIVCFIAGLLMQKVSQIPKNFYGTINKFIINIPLPALVLYNIPRLDFDGKVWVPIASAWLLFIGSALFFWMVKKAFKLSTEAFASLVLVCGLGNTSFIGYPVLTYLLGEESIQYAILVDQPGTFLILSTLGIVWVTIFSGGKMEILNIIKRLFTFPPFLVFIVALIIPTNFIGDNINSILKMIGAWMVPLALLSLGHQFKFDIKEIDYKNFFIGLSYKLIIGPAIILVFLYFTLDSTNEMFKITLLECAMPPMITASIIANQYKLEGQLANHLVTLGIPISMITLAIWNWIL